MVEFLNISDFFSVIQRQSKEAHEIEIEKLKEQEEMRRLKEQVKSTVNIQSPMKLKENSKNDVTDTTHLRLPNAKFPPITALLNRSTYNKSAQALSPNFMGTESMNKLTLNEPAIFNNTTNVKLYHKLYILKSSLVQDYEEKIERLREENRKLRETGNERLKDLEAENKRLKRKVKSDCQQNSYGSEIQTWIHT